MGKLTLTFFGYVALGAATAAAFLVGLWLAYGVLRLFASL